MPLGNAPLPQPILYHMTLNGSLGHNELYVLIHYYNIWLVLVIKLKITHNIDLGYFLPVYEIAIKGSILLAEAPFTNMDELIIPT